jgi:hypothetical protein
VFAIALFVMASVGIQAQESQMKTLIEQSLSKIQQSSPETFLTCVAELKRIDAMYPDSLAPKYYTALQSLNFAITNPQDEQTETFMAEADQAIKKMEALLGADESDVLTMKGFFYMVRIVQDPAKNGPRYYLEVMRDYEKALKLNPDNAMAKQLQEKFNEGMSQR